MGYADEGLWIPASAGMTESGARERRNGGGNDGCYSSAGKAIPGNYSNLALGIPDCLMIDCKVPLWISLCRGTGTVVVGSPAFCIIA